TSLSLSSSQSGSPGVSTAANGLLAYGGQQRYFDAPPATPDSVALLGPSGIAAYQRPHAEATLLADVPSTPGIEATFRLLFSRDAVNFATGMPSVRDFRVSNEVLVGGVFDDNSDPITIFRSSVGTYDGGPVGEKHFPVPNAV